MTTYLIFLSQLFSGKDSVGIPYYYVPLQLQQYTDMSADNEIYRRIHFAVMAIESGARKLGISGKEMHDRLRKQGLIHNRLFNRYEDLHTQSLEWVADDISETLINWESEE